MTLDEAMAYANDGEGLREIEDTCDALDVLQAEAVRLRGIVEKGLDYEHHSSCGHIWTMRHTACPECFAALRQRHTETVQVERLSAYEAALRAIGGVSAKGRSIDYAGALSDASNAVVAAKEAEVAAWLASEAKQALEADHE